jgi:hypothetical protein
MDRLLPTRFLFRYAVPVKRIAALPRGGKSLLKLPAECRLADLGALDEAAPFADVRVAWNEGGLGVAVHVRGKQHPPVGDIARPTESDGMQIWIDTRDTKTIHRASRFCHQFCLLPNAAGKRRDAPAVVQVPVPRAREDAALTDWKTIPVSASHVAGGYSLEAWLSREVLTGFDPESNPRLGFYYCVRDSELGTQFFSVGEEFPVASDPSLWATLELSGA